MPKVTERKKKPSRKEPSYRRLRKAASSRTDWKRLEAVSEEEIEHQAASDTDNPPLPEAEWLRSVRIVMPQPKAPVYIRLDRDVLAFFKNHGPKYQTRINAVLKAYVDAQRKKRKR